MIKEDFFPNNIVMGYSQIKDGPMQDMKNKKEFIKDIFSENGLIVNPTPVHGSDVLPVKNKRFDNQTEGDSIITTEKGVILSMAMADCFPIYFYDPVNKAIGLTHGGWKGLLKGIIENTVIQMKYNFNTNPEDLMVYIGPGICSKCFEVKKDAPEYFANPYSEIRMGIGDEKGKWFGNLSVEIYKRLLSIGCRKFESSGECTCCKEGVFSKTKKYYSFRRDKDYNRNLAFIGIK